MFDRLLLAFVAGALAAVAARLLYSRWRKAQTPRVLPPTVWPITLVFIDGRRFWLAPGSVERIGDGWAAKLVMYLDREGCEFVAGKSRGQGVLDISLDRGKSHVCGRALPARLQFSDGVGMRPEPSPGQRVAVFELRGEGDLRDV